MKTLTLIVVSNLLLFEILSAVLFYAIGFVRPDWRLDLQMDKHFASIDEDYLKEALLRKRDKLLGWDIRAGDIQESVNVAGEKWKATIGPDGARNDGVNHGEVLIATYGDSFTHGHEVNDNETWQYFLENIIEKDVKNYGVSAHGIGQTWLKIQRDLNQGRVEKITIFAIYEDDLNRAVNGFRPFLYRNTSVVLGFKPSFRYLDDKVVLIPNPWEESARTLEDLKAISIRSAKSDYWVSYDNLVIPEFPYSLQGIKTIQYVARRLSMKLRGVNHKKRESLWRTEEGRVIAKHILNEFVAAATEKRSIPVVLFIPKNRNKKSKSWKQPEYINFKKQLQENNSMGLVILDVYDAEFDESLFNIMPFKGHSSRYGNQVIAKYIANRLEALNIAPYSIKGKSSKGVLLQR